MPGDSGVLADRHVDVVESLYSMALAAEFFIDPVEPLGALFGPLEHRKLMLQSLSMRRQKTPSSNRAETRPGRVSWRSWLGPELCVPKEHLDAGMLLRMRQRKRKEWPAPVEPLGRRGGGPSSQGLLVVFRYILLGILWVYTWLSLVWGPARGVGRALPG